MQSLMKEDDNMEFMKNFSKIATETPNRTAVVDMNGRRRTTYAELDKMSGRVYGYLKEKGIGKEDFVVISLPRGVAPVAAMLGVMKAGAAYVLLEEDTPAERLEYILKDCSCRSHITDEIWKEIEAAESCDGFEEVDDHDAAFAVYTSGTTGNPKGVVHEFGNVDRILKSNDCNGKSIHFRDDIFALAAPLLFVASTIVIFMSLNVGFELHILPLAVVKNPPAFEMYISYHKITLFFISPTLYRTLHNISRTVRQIILGGELVCGIWSRRYECCVVYTSSEMGVLVSSFLIDKPYAVTPIGKVKDWIRHKIIDDDGREVLEGEIGELCVETPYVRGYLNQPEQTAAAFEKDRMYHTGDLVRRLQDGNLVVVGRKDEMIKIAGNRIEPAEIEAAAKKVLNLSDCIAKGFTEDNSAYICLYYTDDTEINSDEAREKLSEILPYYMLPSHFIKLDKFPKNANGKTDKKALKPPVFSSYKSEYIAPETEIEKRICEAFEEILKQEKIGIDDNFIALGGDSIKLMKLQAACPEYGFNTKIIYNLRTPRKLAAFAEKEAKNADKNVSKNSKKEIYPLNQPQLGVWLECMKHEGEAIYNNPFLFELPKGIELEKLCRAIEKTLEAHPCVFAEFFIDSEGDPRQKAGDTSYKQAIEELTNEEFEQRKKELVRPFDIQHDRLFRIEIYSVKTDKPEDTAYLFIDFHHLVTDGTSYGILLSDIETAYKGGEIQKETYTIFDAAAEEEKERNGSAYEKAKEWCEEYLEGTDIDNLPQGDKGKRGASRKEYRHISTLTTSELTEQCAVHKTTANVLTNTAFGYLLSECLRKEDTTFATIYNGRSELKENRTVGMMVRTIPMRCRISEKKTTEEYLAEAKENLLGAMANDTYGFSEISSATGIKSDVLFACQDTIETVPTINALELKQIPLKYKSTEAAFNLQIWLPGNGNVTIDAEYDDSMYSEEFIKRLVKCYERILTGLLEKEKLDEIKLVSDEEEQVLLTLGQGERTEYDRSKTFIDLFVRQAKLTPDNTAVSDGSRELTYAELDKRSNSLANELINRGVCPNDFVCVMTDRTVNFPLAVIAVQKAGAAYVPIDPGYPEERIEYMIDDSEAKIFITDHSVYNGNLAFSAEPLFIDEFEIHDSASINLSKPNGLAYMIYTSGTTGEPKGVMISHAALRNLIETQKNCPGLKSDDSTCGYPSFAFDAHIMDLYPVLSVGGSFCIIPAQIRKDIDGIKRYITDKNVTGGTFPTSAAKLLIENSTGMSMRYIKCGGEKLTGIDNCELTIYNCYGPTECTCEVTCGLVVGDAENAPIGRPVNNLTIYVMDSCGRLLPNGIPGELCVTGVQVAEGYWKRSELTSQAFVDNPYGEGKMYRTGDLVRWNEEGQLEYIDRIDNQIKLRGYRIELGEIESKAAEIEGISQAIAEVKKVGGTDRLVLYYTLKEGSEALTAETISELLESSSLANYMVPDDYVKLDTMPLTPNGKINRKALPLPEIREIEYVEPEGETEERIAKAAAEVLGIERVGVDTNLISLGMSSIHIMKLAIKLSSEFGVQTKTSEVMKSPTVREIAKMISSAAETEDIKVDYTRREYYPVTENQRVLYIDWEKDRETTQYNVPALYKLSPDTDTEKLIAALKETINAHSSLKTTFAIIDEDIVQLRRDNEEAKVIFTVLDAEPAQEYFRTKVRPFNLLGGELYRIEVIQSPTALWLFIDIHHTIYDGLSAGILVNTLTQAYNGQPLEAEQYTEFENALYEEALTGTEHYKEAETYFDALVEGAESTRYPVSDKPDDVSRKCAFAEYKIDRTRIDALCRKEGITANAYFLASFMNVLSRVTREENITITFIDNGRDRAEIRESVGMFVKTLPVVMSFDKENDFTATAKACQKEQAESVENSIYPFTQIVSCHGITPEIMYDYQGLDEREGRVFENAEYIPLALDTVKVPLTLEIIPSESEFKLVAEYDTSLYSKHDMETLAKMVGIFAERAAEENDVRKISLTDDAEEQSLLALGEGEHTEYDRRETFIDLFVKQAALTPYNIAVSDGSRELTYAELDRRSNALANELINRGVRPGDFVSVMTDRTVNFPLAAIAVQKAGAAYVPIDPEYPAERITYMIDDSEAKIMITDRSVFNDNIVLSAGRLFIDEFEAHDCTPVSLSRPDGLAYMIYTSGTTGQPKGVMISHSAKAALVRFIAKKWRLTDESRIECHSKFSFDASVEDLYPALTIGGRVYIVPETARKDIELMYRFIIDNHISGGSYATQFGELLLQQHPSLPVDYIVIGSERLAAVPNCNMRFINAYGPTECTVDATYFEIEKDKQYNTVPIGRPLDNLAVYVLDKYGHLMPSGIAGELCVTGAQIAEGYWHRPELTSQVFVNNPYGEGKMYRTGDLVRWNEEGQLEYIGRIDNQVKLRGYRIEFGEIESKASAIEGISQAVAEVKKVGDTDRLVLYYTLKEDAQAFTEEMIRESLESSSLANYMIPEDYVKLDAMPLTPNGKINRKVLPLPDVKEAECVPPADPFEKKLLDAARELLGNDNFGVTDDLFRFGMNSILAMKYAAAIHSICPLIRVANIMRDRNVRSILEGSKRIFELYGEYDINKPLLVFLQGVTVMNATLPKFAEWNKHFNIFVIEPTHEHYRKCFGGGESFADVVEFYSMLLEQNLPAGARVFAFMGFSFGGVLAAYMAEHWSVEHNGEMLPVVMGDSWFINTEPVVDENREKSEAIENNPELLQRETEVYGAEEMAQYAYYVAGALSRSCEPLPGYDGRVVFLRAGVSGTESEASAVAAAEEKNMKYLLKTFSNLQIVDFPQHDHNGLFIDQSLNELYKDILLRLADSEE